MNRSAPKTSVWRRAAGVLWRAGSDFLYPPACAMCERLLPETRAARPSHDLCASCREALWPEESRSCARCGAPAGPHLDTSRGCHHCRDDRFAFDRVARLGVYEGELRRAVLKMKHHTAVPLARACAALLWELAGPQIEDFDADVVVPVPRHWSRRLWRPHNPTEAVARPLARKLMVPFMVDALRKSRRTKRQATLPATRRRANVRGAFVVDVPADVRGRSVLLVDDVLTTGSTAHEAARALRSGGAERVVVAVIARGLGV